MAEKGNMTDLCKEALKRLVDSDDPITLIQDAKETANKKAREKSVGEAVSDMSYGQKLPFAGLHHNVTEYKGWEIVQHNISRHYVLLDSDGTIRAQHWEPDWRGPNFQLFLEVLISLAAKYTCKKMIIYQLVTNKKVDVKKDCEGLTVSEAYNRFPHSKDLASGFFTNHPVDDLALISVQNYFANIALNQDDECVVLLGKIGAKSVHITKVDESKTKNTTDVKAGFEKVNAHVGASIGNELRNSSELIVKFEGHVSDISPDILKNSVWFQNNSQMNAILEARLSESKVIEWDMTTSITQTFNFDFSVAANVLGVVEASLKNEYEKATKQIRKFHVIFGEG